jgi:hypothetical protein
MAFQQNPVSSLEELKRRLEQGKDVEVDEDGKIHLPDDPELGKQQLEGKRLTTIKPTRWF